MDFFKRANGKPRIDVTGLYPPFYAALVELLERCHALGADYYPTSGLRSYEEQDKRYKAYKAGTGTRAAAPGYSQHQFGLAVDLAPDGDLTKEGLQADYSAKMYKTLIEQCKQLGLHDGVGYGDAPHVGWPGFVSGAQLSPLRKVWKATTKNDERAKLRAVWNWLDAQ